MKRVYVAGPIQADNITTIFENLRQGIRAGVKLLLAGHAPFIPHCMFLVRLLLEGGEKYHEGTLYKSDMAWLEVSEAFLLLPGWEHSPGSRAELERAKELGIPAYYTIKELVSNERT